MSGARRRTLIPAAFSDLSQWPSPDEEVLDEKTLAPYLERKRAVQMYADGIAIEVSVKPAPSRHWTAPAAK